MWRTFYPGPGWPGDWGPPLVVAVFSSSGHNVLTMSRLVVPTLLLLAFLSGCGQDSTATAAAGKNSVPKPREVRVVPAAEARVPRTVTVTGALAADDQIVLSLKVTGRLGELTVDLGSSVRAGQVVARLDP